MPAAADPIGPAGAADDADDIAGEIDKRVAQLCS
jgi:hypothetical protein